MKTCFLFPGQGAQYPGMARDLWEESPGVKDLFATASKIIGKDLKGLLFDGNEEDLKTTENTQPAVTLANLSSAVYLSEKGVNPSGCAGFSLGEYSALWQAGILTTEDLFTIVKIRGEIMEAAASKLESPNGNPGMAAVLGLTYDETSAAVENLKGEVYVANYNSPTQVVLAGTFEGLEKADKLTEKAGAARYVRLKVSGPFHTPLMGEARDNFEKELRSFDFSDPKLTIFSNVDGEKILSGDKAKDLCVRQIVSAVLWVAEENSILKEGYESILETGPGKVLRGLWRSFTKEIACLPAGTIEDIKNLG